MSKIEWTDETWNPVTGCSHVSHGCDNCYAAREASGRLKTHPAYEGLAADGKFTGEIRLHPDRLDQPLRWRRPRRVFVNSLSDLFHADVPREFIARVFAVMAMTPQHTYQILTKRPGRMELLLTDDGFSDLVRDTYATTLNRWNRTHRPAPDWPLPNVWLGVSAEDQETADKRIPVLLDTPAAVRFVSCEPLLGTIDLTGLTLVKPEPPHGPGVWLDALRGHVKGPDDVIEKLDWIIVGGESGPKARPMHPDWATSLRDQCVAAGVPYFFKQHGEWTEVEQGDRLYGPGRACISSAGTVDHWDRDTIAYLNESDGTVVKRVGKKAAGRELDGRTWDEMPAPAEWVGAHW